MNHEPCCICGERLSLKADNPTVWTSGHNPYPVMDKGRACDVCQKTVVRPARIKEGFIDVNP